MHGTENVELWGNAEVYSYSHSLSTTGLDGGEWSTSRSPPFTLRREPRYPLNRKASGTQSQSVRLE